MRSGVRSLVVMAAASMMAVDSISIAKEREPQGPPPEGARPRGYPSTGKTYKPNGKRETERRRRQMPTASD